MAPQNRPFRGFKAQKFDVVGSVALVLDETGTAKSELLVLGKGDAELIDGPKGRHVARG